MILPERISAVVRPIALSLAVIITLAAADRPVPDAEQKRAPVTQKTAGSTDAAAAFARQAGSVETTNGTPAIIGAYIWSGRADENYRPFFQWELRIKTADQAVSNLRARIITLGTLRNACERGEWVDLGSLSAAGKRDFSSRLNCAAFPAYEVEVSWSGGSDRFVALDKLSVPVSLSSLSGSSYLSTLNQSFEYAAATRTATVSWALWNLGGVAAKDVVQTISFVDDKGKTVSTHAYSPEKSEVASGYAKEHKVVVPKVPKFATITIATKQADVESITPNSGKFTAANDVEIADIKTDKKTLSARVRNGTERAIAGLTVHLTLVGKNGAAVAEVPITIDHIASGSEQAVSVPYAGHPWISFEMGWTSAGEPAAPSKATGSVTVDGIAFGLDNAVAVDGKLTVSGSLINARETDLDNVAVEFTVSGTDAKGQPAQEKKSITIDHFSREHNEPVELKLDGLVAFNSLAMKWSTVQKVAK
jgi:hypothetical protein